MAAKPSVLRVLRSQVRNFRHDRERIKEDTQNLSDVQRSLIEEMLDAGVSGDVGLVISPNDPKSGVAYVQQNKPQEFWDTEAIIEYLHKNPGMWRDYSSRVFDVQKWEAGIANGAISAKTAKKFKKTGAPPSPFIRFGKKTEDSL